MLKNYAKRIVPIILAALMVISMLPAQVLAQAADVCDHVIVIDATVPATCTSTGLSEGSHCSVCGEVIKAQTVLEKLPHSLVQNDGKKPTYTESGWEPYETCDKCDYSTFVSLPALGEAQIDNFDEFIANLGLLEDLANMYVGSNPGKDPAALVIKYIRTGVDRYNSGSWGIMAGYEDAGFAKFVRDMEDQINAGLDESEMLKITGLKNINNFELPNGDYVDIGHVFGSMDITYHNKSSINHADVSGWAGDLVDLLEVSDIMGVKGDLDAMIKNVADNYLGKTVDVQGAPSFSQTDIYGDLDAYYIMQTLYNTEYEAGSIATILTEYFTEDLNDEQRADYFLKNRLQTTGTRLHIRNAVYNAYIGNSMVATLEGTREFSTADISNLRKAVCYAFADYLCQLAGDYVEDHANVYFELFESSSSVIAPGITQESCRATSADGKQMVYYLATADLSRDDVNVYANYNNNDPTTWAMSRVLDQANAAQVKYGNSDSEHYIANYNVVASINGAGFNMSTGEPSGLLVMNGKEYHSINSNGFFGILDDGKAVVGTTEEYNTIYKNRVKEGIAGFGSTLIKDGKIVASNGDGKRASRTAVGITRTGKVVFMVLDGRQEPVSCGGSMLEIAQIMLEAGCVNAVNLDGGGSSTFVAKPEGSEELSVINNPSDGFARSVSTSLMMVSTAPSSTAFDHARLDSDYDYVTIGTSMKVTPVGISATGDLAELPEGYTWAVSNARWGSITADGVFTGLRNGTVEVYLMHGDTTIGQKTINIVVPDNIYYSREKMDVVYGSTITLPVIALYENKKVAINENDIVFTLNNTSAGTIDGFTFTAKENITLKVVKITAALSNDESIISSISVNLYNQGENTFDFDKATGGDRMLAYDRVVSNSTTVDNTTYYITNTDEDMVTSYTFAMDLTQIPIPERLADLVYMLPGADMENASAWNFLLQLAERISVLTEVTPVLRFDPNVTVDYSGLKIMNEYFSLTSTSFDEATNTLTLKLNWIDQTKAIDPATANPLCLVSGIKLTPKENAAWDANKRMSVLHSGQISYNVFMRASALYSFAQKPENQEIYGLMPFVNPNLPSEAGASFGAIYKTFEDSYILAGALKNGWVNEDGKFAYYLDGKKVYGVKEIDGYYYDFGSKGLNDGQTKFTGLWLDESVNAYRYCKLGLIEAGWQMIGNDWYYFDTITQTAVTGVFNYTDEIVYELDATGKLVKGFWAKTLYGLRYYYGPGFHSKGWKTIDGKDYFFENGVCLRDSIQLIRDNDNYDWYQFDETGACDKSYIIPDGFYTDRNGYGYSKDGKGYNTLTLIDGVYYYFNYMGYAQKGEYAGLLFGDDYKAFTGLVTKNGVIYYYDNGRTAGCGLYKLGDDYYYSYWGGVIKTGKQYASQSYCDLPAGEYEFGTDGKMLQGVVEKDGQLYYYENGRTGTYGLIKYDNAYYYVYWGGVIRTGKQYVSKTYCDLPAGEYEFGTDGKMIRGIIEKDGQLYYYENGKTGTYGLIKFGEDYYYVYWGGVIRTGKLYVGTTFCDLPAGEYEFGEDGKMLRGIVEKNGQLYYYENGRTGTYGLVKYNDDYYYVYWGGVVRTGKLYVGTTFCDLPAGEYEFGEDGKMLQGIVEKDGQLYYYENGKTGTYGLVKYNDDYYYVYWGGVIRTGKQYVSKSFCDIPAGEYEFGADGKMLNGIVEKDGQLYYYENGKTGSYGLVKFGEDYYYVYWGGVIRTGKQYVSKSFCDIPAGEYEFGADGKMLAGFVEKESILYYYTNGKTAAPGLIFVDGYYYFINWGGVVVKNKTQYVWETNGYTIRMNYTFDEFGHAII